MRSIILPVFFLFFGLAEASAQITLNPVPTRVIGQDSVTINNLNPNLVEGREFELPTAIALDTTTSPPALYVSDTTNNRVLGFHNAASFSNGQLADIVIGQPDMDTTLAAGPGTSRTTGLSGPTGLAVDGNGNLYVVDSSNNRILRFPKPFSQTSTQLPDLVIGQSSFATAGANQGGISAATLSFTVVSSTGTTSPLLAFITFDSAGNLWVADAGNNRILRFNASVLGSQPTSGPAADLVLGQVNFTTNTYSPAAGTNPLLSMNAITTPTAIAFDAAGRLFVSESVSTQRGRVLMWAPPFVTGQSATRLLAVDTDNPQPPTISEFQLAASPGAIFPVPNPASGLTSIGVVDTLNNRILIFPPVEQWTTGTTYQAATVVVGQSDFSSGNNFAGQIAANASGFNRPVAALFYGNELYVSDTFDNRVIVMPQIGPSFGAATSVLGQYQLNLNAPNLVEGREFNFSSGNAGVAVDVSANPPHLYVADSGNNRILCYYDSRNINAGVKADLVIGQPDFQQTLVNYPSNNPLTPNASGLFSPIGLIVDPAGNLYVADTGNSRVLRFPAPFASYVPGTPAGTPPPVMAQANLVLGQLNFTSVITDATQRTMASPYGLALTNFPGLLVSDTTLNRVLFFAGTSANLSSFTSGMPATMVFGQPDYDSGGSGSGSGQLNSPRHLGVDSDDRLYVADTGNSRIAIWDHAPTAVLGQPAAQFLTNGLRSPVGLYVNDINGDIWVGDAGVGQAIRYPAFNALEANGYAPNAVLTDQGGPLAVSEDAWGNLFLGDFVNRVLIYYPGLGAINAASFLGQNALAPGMIAALFTEGNSGQFEGQASSATALPLPTHLNGVQVLFNGSAVPLFYADPNQINFEVPMGAPQTGTADLQVVQTATGRVLGDTTVGMVPADPGIFTDSGNGIGTAAALNQDNTINSPTNPAVAGQVIQIFGTGQGFVPGAPPDGSASSGQLQSTRAPTVIMGPEIITGSAITYAGLAPGEVGVWQVNVTIPSDIITLPTNPTYVVIIQDSVASGSPASGRAVQIYVKQPG